MPKGPTIEQSLTTLSRLRAAGSAAAPELQKYLAHKINLIVAKAADLTRELNLKHLQPHLESAFTRFMQNPATTDKTCAAKQAIANALYELGAGAQQTFLTGIHHIQKEGAYGQPVDTAAELRGLCALGLVRMAYRDVMPELVQLLVDESHQARIMAARAIAYAGRDEGALLLRLKILTGDQIDDVTGECLIALAALSRTKSLSFIKKYLDSPSPALAESAAMAIGEMRDESALTILIEHWLRDPFPESRKSLALPIALSRLPRSLEFLLNIVATESEAVSAAAIEALLIYRHVDAARARIESAVASRNSPKITATYKKHFQ